MNTFEYDRIHLPVGSEAVGKVVYNSKNNEIGVVPKDSPNKLYVYKDVHESWMDAFVNTDSAGRTWRDMMDTVGHSRWVFTNCDFVDKSESSKVDTASAGTVTMEFGGILDKDYIIQSVIDLLEGSKPVKKVTLEFE